LSMGAYVIREMKMEDLPGVLRLEKVSFPTPWTEWMFRAQLGLGDMTINLVLVEDVEIMGYATALAALGEIHLLSIAVYPGRRRRGYGSAILEEVISRGRATGCKRVFLEVREGNGAAKAFYSEAGFLVIGRRKRYYIDTGEDAIIMELDLERERDGRTRG
jgi:ribosomal-protein-alanine N-acetyltransferase